ncbi:MAG TPA: L,D-transpeptidase [Anaerolinea thermolimosa]|uniref:L,D-transpeptidase n=1 Tax=Anaerolinea thermolimosa TaxID=229919 RepID=A0A3D1JIT8_9CHLR|nr:L,D-transpeptidase [Anaerolinea thermolimosa]GAP08005.1 uncharacterized protein conserved in bacteria [Anaerolinea thermolimosa]HCE18501.1 L,D-transpeptidase [Anaerolinea thermolimosa]
MHTLYAPDLAPLSRREFLKFSAQGFLGLFALPFLDRYERWQRLNTPVVEPPVKLGRTVDDTVEVFDRPSFSATLLHVYWKDLVFEIDEVTYGDEKPRHNRVWYHIKGEGYAHSGKIQPVELRLNPVVRSVPEYGRLAEVTVPYTDTLRDFRNPQKLAYRLYYSTVHWVMDVTQDGDGNTWYRLWDDKFKVHYYARGEHLRMLEPEDVALLSPTVPPEGRRIEVWLRDQIMIAYENDEPALITRASTGGRFIDGDYTTPRGVFITNRKRPSRHMASEDLAAPNSYDLPGVPWVCYITGGGISFHGTYWHNDFGKPRSHGCINLTPQAAHWLYRWSLPSVPFDQNTWIDEYGTQVRVI